MTPIPKLFILTRKPRESFFDVQSWKELLKEKVKTLINKRGGPEAVKESLLKGLYEIGQAVRFNPPSLNEIPNGATIGVLSSTAALGSVLRRKQQDPTLRIIAGPNLVVTPVDAGGILLNENINAIALPSEWSKEVFEKTTPSLRGRITVWPAGVDVPEVVGSKSEHYIVYYKTAPPELKDHVLETLNRLRVPFSLIRYGHYTKESYFSLLSRSKGLIYLQESESQGIALFEAWAHDVPVLAWNKGVYTYQQTGTTIKGPLAAPYLTPQNGMFFPDAAAFEKAFLQFRGKYATFKAREYVLANFTHRKCAEHYLNLARNS